MPIEWGCSLSGVSLIVPYYHMVSDNYVPHVNRLYRFRTIAEFTADVEYLLRHFQPVTLSDIVDQLNGTRTLKRPSFHLTFDDGFREMYDVVAPILQRAGAPATFFINTAFVDGGGLAHHNALSVLLDRLQSNPSPVIFQRAASLLPAEESDQTNLRARILSIRQTEKSLVRSLAETLELDLDQYIRQNQPYLSSEQIAALLDRGFGIGAHSHDHPRYSDLPLSEQIGQTLMSMDFLETRFGIKPKAFAFPYTDSGVEGAFFDSVFAGPLLDVSFGTAGLVPHFHPRNIERMSMEKTSAPAAQILARQFARTTYFRLQPH